MNHLTTLYVNQIDRERDVTEGLRNRQILQADAPDHVRSAKPSSAATTATASTMATAAPTAAPRPASTSPRATSIQARATGR